MPTIKPQDRSVYPRHSKYRPDIDGLRAIAVLSVVAFHAFPRAVAGGFIGVDIFFVISGFLISIIIFSNLETGSFSFARFYSRRIRRIFPALLLVMTLTVAVGWFALLAGEYGPLGKHVAGASVFLSNFILWGETGYFDEAAETKPLLHLWSLAIEEQFYLFWPLLTSLAWKHARGFSALTVAIAVLSFAFGVHLIGRDGAAAFYSPFSRFWELMVGSLLAYISLHGPVWTGTWRNVQAVLGLGLLAAGLLLIDKTVAFPGWWALLPTLGAFFVIAAGPTAWINSRLLSSKVAVWFGLISYPLYLWHWPLLSFTRIVTGRESSVGLRSAAVAMAILLAWLTYRFVERPVRFGRHGAAKVAVLAGLMALIGIVGGVIHRAEGLPARDTSAALKVINEGDIGQDEYFRYATERFGLCDPEDLRLEAPEWKGHTRCLQSEPGAANQVAIVGDSHAEHLFIGFAEKLQRINVVYYAKNGVPFLENAEFGKIYRHVLGDDRIKKVILSAFWSERIVDRVGFEKQLSSTVERLTAAGKQVYVLDDPPNFSFSPRKCKYQENWIHTNQCADDEGFFDKQRRQYMAALQTVGKMKGVTVIDAHQYFCGKGSCSMVRDGRLLFRDRHHLNVNGSRYLSKVIVENYPGIADFE